MTGRRRSPPAGEPASNPAGDLPRTMKTAGTKDSSPKLKRKKIARTFDRRPKSWMQPFLELPYPTSEQFFNVRHDVLSLSRADACRLLRIKPNTIWDWETGRREPQFIAFLVLRLLVDSARHSSSSDPWRLLGSVSADAVAGGGEAIPIAANMELLPPELPAALTGAELDGRAGWKSRAIRLRDRMKAFTAIYNAAWHVRDSYYGAQLRRQENVWRFVNVVVAELRSCRDFEALIYAVADSLTASPHGVPWER